MLPWRNYLVISLIMAAVVAFCVSLAITRDKFNNYDDNDFAVSYNGAYPAEKVWSEENAAELSMPRRYVLYLGDAEKDEFGNTAKQWCAYSKRILRSETMPERLAEQAEDAEAILIDPDYLSADDFSELKQISDSGTALVFMKLPESGTITGSPQLKELLGISGLESENCRFDGIKLFPGFLLGGGGEYNSDNPESKKKQDMKLTADWYRTEAGTKIYMTGVFDDDTVKNEDLPPLIWQACDGRGMVFAVNGDYLSDAPGMGILEAMMSELHDCELYPVVNSRVMTLLNGPDVSSENNDDMQRLYGRDLTKTNRELVLPVIASMSDKLGFPMNGMLTLKEDESDESYPDPDDLKYYMKWFNDYRSEVGLSVTKKERRAVLDVISEYAGFFSDNNITYQFKGLYADAEQIPEITDIMNGADSSGILDGINTVICGENNEYPVLSYLNDTATMQAVTNDGYKYKFSNELNLRCYETALGYSNISADFNRISFPEKESDNWNPLSIKLSKNLDICWELADIFDKNTISESDKRVRQFLTLDYSFERRGNVIYLEAINVEDTAWFILRTHGEKIKDIKGGGDWKPAGDNTYLISVTGEMTEITLEQENKLYYY